MMSNHDRSVRRGGRETGLPERGQSVEARLPYVRDAYAGPESRATPPSRREIEEGFIGSLVWGAAAGYMMGKLAVE